MLVIVLVSIALALCILSSLDHKGLFNLGLEEAKFSGLDFVRDAVDAFISGEGGEAATSRPASGEAQVHYLNMGQADSILIRGPEKTVLIDAGENDQGGAVLEYLASQGVTRLDYVIGTHPHSDHIGGMDTVIDGIDVGDVILPEIPRDIVPTGATYTGLLNAIERKGLSITAAVPGDRYDLGGGAALTILGPVAEYGDLNNMSVVSRLDYGSHSFLFTGDIEKDAESDLLDTDAASLSAEVLDAGHHGSKTSSSQRFLEAVSPSIAVISCGLDNSYGHPHREVVERLENLGAVIYRTDLYGAVVFSMDAEEMTVQTDKDGYSRGHLKS